MEMSWSIRPLKILQLLYPQSVWYFDDQKIRFTFDDGPGPITAEVFDLLTSNGLKGYFFMLPGQAEKQKELCRDIAAAGHEMRL